MADVIAGTIKRWLDEAREIFAERIAAQIDDAPDTAIEALLGCIPPGLARGLAADLASPTPTTGVAGEWVSENSHLADAAAVAGLPIDRLLRTFDLAPSLASLFALMLLGESDMRWAPLFAYLNDDAQRRHLTIGVAERLVGAFGSTELFGASGVLQTMRLAEVTGSADSLLPDRSIRWNDHIAQWLLGNDDEPTTDPALSGYLVDVPVVGLNMLFEPETAEELAASARGPVVVLTGTPGSGRALAASALAAGVGRHTLVLNGHAVSEARSPATLLRLAARDAALRGACLLITDGEELAGPDLASLIADAVGPVWLTTTRRLDLELPHIALPPLDQTRTERLWSVALGEHRRRDASTLAHQFRLAPQDILRIVEAEGPGADLLSLRHACLARSSRTLDTLATQVVTRHAWEDLVLPRRQRVQLEQLVSRVSHARAVYDSWGFGEKLAPSRGLAALFSGPSGAGKTLSASIVAGALGLPLYRVDLSSTVSKYIGETEKNLEAIFAAAEAGNACLFFDECDALFAKRSEVSDAHDRYANLETSYLLQRLEMHRGIVMMASNHPQNIDEAFARRIDITVEFPMPDSDLRGELWAVLLPKKAEADIDALALGAQFELSGGSIRNCLLNAAFLAANEGASISTRHCIRAVAEEYQKLGKPLTRAEFGDAFGAIRFGT